MAVTVLGTLSGVIIASCKSATIYLGLILGAREKLAMSIAFR